MKIDAAPTTLLREGSGEEGDATQMRARFEKMIRAAQDEICDAISERRMGSRFTRTRGRDRAVAVGSRACCKMGTCSKRLA